MQKRQILIILLIMAQMLVSSGPLPSQETGKNLKLALSQADLRGTGLSEDIVFTQKESSSFGVFLHSTEGLQKVCSSSASVKAGCRYSIDNPKWREVMTIMNPDSPLEVLNIKGELFLYSGAAGAQACFNELVSKREPVGAAWKKDGATVDYLSKNLIGDRSWGMCYCLPASHYYGTNPEIYTKYRRDMDIYFEVGNAVACGQVMWIENIPRTLEQVRHEVIYGRPGEKKGNCAQVPVTLRFNDSEYGRINATREKILALMKNWASRIGEELQRGSTPQTADVPQISVEIRSDKKEYEAGERVLFSGSLKKGTAGKLVNYGKKAKFSLSCTISGGETFIVGLRDDNSGKERKPIETSGDGTFSFAPFAPHQAGTYTVTASIRPADFPELKSAATSAMAAGTVSFSIREPSPCTPEDLKGRREKIIDLFRKEVPSHQSEVIRELKGMQIIRREEACISSPVASLSASSCASGLILLQFLFPGPPEYDPMLLGAYNNQLFNGNGYTCFAYGVRTLQFLNRLRFNRDAGKRALLRGINYGPVVRGIEREEDSILQIITGYTCGEHHAVVLYCSHEEWNSEASIILDPWPTQKPGTYGVDEFRKFYGTEYFSKGRWKVRGDAEQWKYQFPLIGSPVYWNFEWDNYSGPGTDTFSEDTSAIEKSSFYLVGACPITLEVTDHQGRRLGIGADGELVALIPGTELFIHRRSKNDQAWYVKLPEGSYKVSFFGTADGTAHITTGRGNGMVAGYKPEIRKGDCATLVLAAGSDIRPLNFSDGRSLPPVMYRAPKPIVTPIVMILAAVVIMLIAAGIASAAALYFLVKAASRKTSRSHPSSPETAPVIFCRNCGKSHDASSRFCSSCGAPLR